MSERQPAKQPIFVIGMRSLSIVFAALSFGAIIGAAAGAVGAILCTLPIAAITIFQIKKTIDAEPLPGV